MGHYPSAPLFHAQTDRAREPPVGLAGTRSVRCEVTGYGVSRFGGDGAAHRRK